MHKSDIDAGLGIFFDGFIKVVFALSLFIGTKLFAKEILLNYMLPGVWVTTLLGNGGLWLYYRRVQKRVGLRHLTAIPGGIQSVRTFIWLFSIFVPIVNQTNDPQLAFKVVILVNIISSICFLIGIVIVPWLLKRIPEVAVLGSIAGGAMAFMVLQSFEQITISPLIGVLALFVVLAVYLGEFKLPISVLSCCLLVGVILSLIQGNLEMPTVLNAIKLQGIYGPKFFVFWDDANVWQYVISYLPLAFIFAWHEVITSIQAVDQAVQEGEGYFEAKKPLVICGLASLVGSCMGNPLPFALYWGYPGWKKIKAGTKYHLVPLFLYTLFGLTGVALTISGVISISSIIPIILFIGMLSYNQAFEIVDRRYYPAVVIATLPMVFDFISNKVSSPELMLFKHGAILLSLIWGCIVYFIIDKRWQNCSLLCLVAITLTGLGFIHSPNLVGFVGAKISFDMLYCYGLLTIFFTIAYWLRSRSCMSK